MTVPAFSYGPSTVYVTLPGSSDEVNLSELPTTTLTRLETIYTTINPVETVYVSISESTLTEQPAAAATSSPAGQLDAAPSYESTITETAVITVANVNPTPFPSGGSVSNTETATPNGIINYSVENGTTYWLNGQTPVQAGSYVYATSLVIPVYATPSSEEPASTLTLHSTIYLTQKLTSTETSESSSTSSGLGVVTSASAGTRLAHGYTGMGTSGWNTTKTSTAGEIGSGKIHSSGGMYASSGVLGSGATNAVTAAISFVTGFSTFDIYQTSHYTISLSSLAAQAGFNALTTSTSYPVTATSSPSGGWITAVINGQTVSWGGNGSSSITPYANSTFTSSTRSSSPSSASGVLTSLTSNPTQVTNGSSSTIMVNATSATSSVSGGLLSLPSTISLQSYSYSSAVVNSTSSTSSALGALTSLSSSSSLPTYGSSSTLLSRTAGASSLFSTYSTSLAVTNSTINSSSAASTSPPTYSSSSTPSSVLSRQSSTSVSSSASATPSNCGEYGNFTLNVSYRPTASMVTC